MNIDGNKILRRIVKCSKSADDAFSMHHDIAKLSSNAVNVAALIRGNNRKPAIILHVVMPRSGTVYIGEVLSLHPDLHAYTNRIWEISLLLTIGEMIRVHKLFFKNYKQNIWKIGENDLLPLFGSSFIGYLHSFTNLKKQILLKVPNIQYLSYFFTLFPHEYLILALRDGRDIVNSTVKTRSERDFSVICRLWNDSMKTVLYLRDRCPSEMKQC